MKANIVIMGQSGTGKSTLVNSIMEEKVAPTGKGVAVTLKNKIYTKDYKIGRTKYELNLYDTVGLELSEKTTRNTLESIEEHIKKSKADSVENDINIVWFCINHRSSRFQDFEVDLIKKLSYDHEIPFVIVLTQCFENVMGELESEINKELPEIITLRVLAEDYKIRGGTVIPAYGVKELLKLSISSYSKMKTKILETKLNKLQNNVNISEWFINQYSEEAQKCINRYADKATKIGFIPGGCIPIVHGMCIKMVTEIHSIYNLSSSESLAEDIFVHAIIGLIATPLMVIPLLSAAVASSYVQTVGDQYREALGKALENSKYGDLKNQRLMAERIKSQLRRK